MAEKENFIFVVIPSLFAALMVESNYTYVLIVPLSTIYMLIEYMKSYNCSDGITDIYNQ